MQNWRIMEHQMKVIWPSCLISLEELIIKSHSLVILQCLTQTQEEHFNLPCTIFDSPLSLVLLTSLKRCPPAIGHSEKPVYTQMSWEETMFVEEERKTGNCYTGGNYVMIQSVHINYTLISLVPNKYFRRLIKERAWSVIPYSKLLWTESDGLDLSSLWRGMPYPLQCCIHHV